jgi:glutamine amidotransferase
MYAQTGMLEVTQELPELAPRLLEQIPEYLRRNIKGRTCSELIFHLFLSMLHDEGNIDDPNLPPAATRRALAATLRVVMVELEKLGRTGESSVVFGNVALSNGRSMVVAHPDPLSEPLRLRRLWVTSDRGEPERGPDAFRGVLFVAGGEGDSVASNELGFEDVFARHSVLVSRDLQVTLADLAP